MIWTAKDWHPALRVCQKYGTGREWGILHDHGLYADHCQGWEVLAWPCPVVSRVLDRLMGDDA